MALLRSLSLDEKTGGQSLLPEEPADAHEQQERPSKALAGEDEAAAGAGGAEPQGEEPQPPEQQLADEEDPGAFLPDDCVKLIQAHLIQGEPLGVALLHLLSMAGTCRQWRAVASELAQGSALALDSFENSFSSQPAVQRFRKLGSADKEVVFTGAARLFTGGCTSRKQFRAPQRRPQAPRSSGHAAEGPALQHWAGPGPRAGPGSEWRVRTVGGCGTGERAAP